MDHRASFIPWCKSHFSSLKTEEKNEGFNLPDEITTLILGKLSALDWIQTCQLVCCKWKMLSNTYGFWRQHSSFVGKNKKSLSIAPLIALHSPALLHDQLEKIDKQFYFSEEIREKNRIEPLQDQIQTSIQAIEKKVLELASHYLDKGKLSPLMIYYISEKNPINGFCRMLITKVKSDWIKYRFFSYHFVFHHLAHRFRDLFPCYYIQGRGEADKGIKTENIHPDEQEILSNLEQNDDWNEHGILSFELFKKIHDAKLKFVNYHLKIERGDYAIWIQSGTGLPDLPLANNRDDIAHYLPIFEKS